MDSKLEKINLTLEGLKQLQLDLETQINELTRAGVQDGSIHFKSDRPDTMFIWEPMKDGKRKYIHVGKNPDKQQKKREEVERWQKRDQLKQLLADVMAVKSEIDYKIDRLLSLADSHYIKKSIASQTIN